MLWTNSEISYFKRMRTCRVDSVWFKQDPWYAFVLFLQSFKQMIASCLVKDPSKRPSANKLLKHSFFKQARSNDYIVRKLLDGLPNLGDRIQALKVCELTLKYMAAPIISLISYYDFNRTHKNRPILKCRERKKTCLLKRRCPMGKRRNYRRFECSVV